MFTNVREDKVGPYHVPFSSALQPNPLEIACRFNAKSFQWRNAGRYPALWWRAVIGRAAGGPPANGRPGLVIPRGALDWLDAFKTLPQNRQQMFLHIFLFLLFTCSDSYQVAITMAVWSMTAGIDVVINRSKWCQWYMDLISWSFTSYYTATVSRLW